MFPVLEQLLIRHQLLILKVVRYVDLSGRRSSVSLEPVMARACTVDPWLNIDVVRPACSPIVTGAFPVVVLPRRAEALRQLARLQQDVADRSGFGLKERQDREADGRCATITFCEHTVDLL